MRTDLWGALAAALRRGPDVVVLSPASDGALARLTDALGDTPVVVTGEAARYAIAHGIAAEGGRPVMQLGEHVPADVPDGLVAIATTSPAAAAGLAAGLPVVRPALADDLASLLDGVVAPLVVQMGPAAAADEATPSVARWEPRVWKRGSSATLVVSGAALDVVLPIARMLSGRGVPTTVVEVPVLAGTRQHALTEYDVFFAGPGEAADEVIDGGWPVDLQRIELVGRSARSIMEAVLASLPARPDTL